MLRFTADESDEYSDGEFVENRREKCRRNPRDRRPKKASREKALYGVFLSDDDSGTSDDGGGGGRQRVHKRSRRDDMYLQPVQFVTGGRTAPKPTSKRRQVASNRPLTYSDEELISALFPKHDSSIVVGYASSSSESDSSQRNKMQRGAELAAVTTTAIGNELQSLATAEAEVFKSDESSCPSGERLPRGRPLSRRLLSRSETSSPLRVRDSDSDGEGPGVTSSAPARSEVNEEDWRAKLERRVQAKKEAERVRREALRSEQRRKERAEQHTISTGGMSQLYGKGFSMMKKMGYAGGGLGREGTGMVNPLLVRIRQKHRGLQEAGERLQEGDQRAARVAKPVPEPPRAADGSARWRKGKGPPTLPRMRRTAADVTAEARVRILDDAEGALLTESGASSGSSGAEDIFPVEGAPPRKAISSRRMELRRQQARLRVSLHSTTDAAAQTAAPLRIVDMTGPSHRVIEDVADLRATLVEANVKAARSVRFRRDEGRSVSDAESRLLLPVDAQRYQFYATGEVKSVPLPKMDAAADQPASAEESVAPLETLRRTIRLCIERVEAGIQQKARCVLIQESKFQQSLEKEKEIQEQLASAQNQLKVVQKIVERIEEFRQSKGLRWIEKTSRRQGGFRGGDGASQFDRRLAAVRKYVTASAAAANVATPTADQEEFDNMQMSDEEFDGPAQRMWRLAAQDRQRPGQDRPTATTEEETIVLSSDDDQELEYNEQTLAGDTLESLTSLFESIVFESRNKYFSLQLPQLASHFLAAILAYADTRVPPHETTRSELDPVLLVPEILRFRERCLPLPVNEVTAAEVEVLRSFWKSRAENRLENALRMRLRSVLVEPRAQELSTLQSVLAWAEVLDINRLATMLDEELFPRWLKVLELWLLCPNVNLEEVHVWYAGWRSLLPPAVAAHGIIQAQFMRGLRLISAHLERLQLAEPTPSQPEAEPPSYDGNSLEPPSFPREPSPPLQPPPQPPDDYADDND